MLILKSGLLNKFSKKIVFGFSTKIGLERGAPYYFNLSKSVDDEETAVDENRNAFYQSLGLTEEKIVLQKQIHGDRIAIINSIGNIGENDAMITKKVGVGLAISSGDCVPAFFYDTKKNIIGAAHSGWRGTKLRIIEKTLNLFKSIYQSNPEDIVVYLGPSISQKNYEVDIEVANQFDEKLIKPKKEKFLLDLVKANTLMIKQFGIPAKNIQISNLCSYEQSHFLHSYRREGAKSGRSLGIIAIKEN